MPSCQPQQLDCCSAVSYAEVTGQVLNVRRASKRLVFADLQVDCPNNANDDTTGLASPDSVVVELVVKMGAEAFANETAVATAHHVSLKPGNVVMARGQWCDVTHMPGTRTLDRLTSLAVCSQWSDLNPRIPFVRPVLLTSRSSASETSQSESAEATNAQGNAHSNAALEDPCKFWVSQGRCHRGDSCCFTHGDTRGARHEEWISMRKQRRRAAAAIESGDPHGDDVANKGCRAEVFVNWLEATFGLACLATGDGVLDVAGGKGDVSFELFNKRQLPCTLVDPRPRKLSISQRKWLAREEKRRKVETISGNFHRSNKSESSERFESAATLSTEPGGQNVVDGVGAVAADSTASSSSSQAEPTQPIKDPCSSELCHHIQAEFGLDNWSAFAGCSVAVGMHPDEATEAIVDFALAHQKPFAVVPCCVFPSQFPKRLTPEGQVVTTRAELVSYLVAKAGAEIAFLDVQGANQVVWRR